MYQPKRKMKTKNKKPFKAKKDIYLVRGPQWASEISLTENEAKQFVYDGFYVKLVRKK